MELPTAPIGKQQVIDLHAGAILRSSHCEKCARYLGFSARFLISALVVVKCFLLAGWLLWEYYHYDVRCAFILHSQEESRYAVPNNSYPHLTSRFKRSAGLEEELDPRFPRRRPLVAPLSTLVTLTNTQMLPYDGSKSEEGSLKMKTIRKRLETIRKGDYSPESESVEIDLNDPPVIHMSKILKRGQEHENEVPTPTKKTKRKKGKGRGRGRKKNKKMTTSTTASTTLPNKTKKRKGLGRKKNKPNSEHNTKSPRHIFSPLTPSPTRRPHQSDFISGLINVHDKSFSNQGHIRAYPMHTASRRPLRLTPETEVLWRMNETSFANIGKLQPSHNHDSKEALNKIESKKIAREQKKQIDGASTTTTTTATTTAAVIENVRRDFYSTHKQNTWKNTDMPPTTGSIAKERNQSTKHKDQKSRKKSKNKHQKTKEITHGQVVSTAPSVYYERINDEKRIQEVWEEQHPNEYSSEIEDNEEDYYHLNDDKIEGGTERTIRRPKIKHGFNRSMDDVIDDVIGDMNFPKKREKKKENTVNEEPTPKESDPEHFQEQLSSFSNSVSCIARSLFDLWCACQLITCFPFCIGVCAGRRSLFVAHLVLDILFLVIGFVYSLTMVVFSILLYVLVGDMPSSTLLEWLLYAALLDVVLVLYSLSVVLSLRCCERIVAARKSSKLQNRSFSFDLVDQL